MSNIRDLFSVARDPKDKIPPDLKPALTLLRLNGLDDLEERFLSTDAFLKPWSVFRDSILLLQPDAMPHATLIRGAGSGISRLDLLWFYTQFDEGVLRYDSRADRYSEDYTPDATVYGTIDKSNWRVEEYEKHLYAWLLQEFKVGKAYNPWRFECFELKNICTAWEDILVPVVNAVRASYDRRGRRYYGRLALFIEARSPSRLAFPDSNVGVPEGGVLSPTPYRVVSAPKNMLSGANTFKKSYSYQASVNGVLSKKHYDETERELRDVYPQYGGLVERPRFKVKMEEWLAEQRLRAERRREQHQRHGEVRTSRPQIVQRGSSRSRSPSKQLPERPRGIFRHSYQQQQGSGSPIKQFAGSVKRSLSLTMSSMLPKDEQKSPLHGVTRQLHFPEPSRQTDDSARSSVAITSLPRPDPQNRMPSEVSVYTSIRNSNPFTEDIQAEVKALARANTVNLKRSPQSQRARANTAHSVYSPTRQRTRTDTDDSVFSPMVQLSAIPRPLWPEDEAPDGAGKQEPEGLRDVKPREEHYAIHPKKSYHDVRIPSYEGTAYQDEISLTDLHNQRLQAARSPESTRSAKPATRLPAPITPVPYSGPRLASADRKDDAPSKVAATLPVPKPVASAPKAAVMLQKLAVAPVEVKHKKSVRPAKSPPKTTAWPGFDSDDEDTPPVPPKSPDRQNKARAPGQLRNPRSRQLMREDKEHEMSRIVSKENIRAALGRISRESSAESLAPPKPVAEPVRTMSPMKQQLKAYNTNMFPRKEEHKGTPVGQWFKEKAEEGRYEPGGAFELEVLKVDRKEDHAED